MDPIEFGKQIGALVREVAAKAVAAVAERVESLERKLAALPSPEKGDKGDAGDKGDPGPKGDKGDPGERGASVTAAEVLPALRDELRQAIAAMPTPKNGASVSIEDVMPALERALEGYVARWALDFERRAQETLQRAVDRLPAPKNGEDGKNGFSLDDFDAQLADDGRTLVLTFQHGDEPAIRRELAIPALIDRGVYREGEAYRKGDGTTWGGSYWIAQRDTSAKPDASDDWRLAVRKGRDGKNGERGRDYAPPAPVKVG